MVAWRTAARLAAMQRYDREPLAITFEGGLRLWIPAHYLEPPYGRLRGEKRVVGIQFLWPSLEGMTNENRERFLTPGFGSKIRVLIQSLHHVRPERKRDLLRLYLESWLEPYDSKRWPDEYGLRRFELHTKAPWWWNRWERFESRRLDDLYYRETGGRVATMIRCNWDRQERPRNSPGCRHTFLLRDLDIEVRATYSARFLPVWRTIERRVGELIRGFTRAPVATAGGE